MNQNLSFNNFGSFLAKLTLLYFALISSTLLIGVVFYFLTQDNTPPSEELFLPLIVVSIAFLFSSLFVLKFINGIQLKIINNKNTISEKLLGYFALQIIKFAMIEGVALLTLVGFYLTGNNLFFIVFIGALSFYILEKPSKEKFLFEVSLSADEKEKILNNSNL